MNLNFISHVASAPALASVVLRFLSVEVGDDGARCLAQVASMSERVGTRFPVARTHPTAEGARIRADPGRQEMAAQATPCRAGS